MELGNIKLTWTEIGTLVGKRRFLCDQIVKFMRFGETNDYETSDVRKWLNGEFLNSFSEEEKSKLVSIPLTGRSDKFFLLDETSYTECEKKIVDIGSIWWLQSPTYYKFVNAASIVNYDGGIIRIYATEDNVGVRPACLMD